MQVNRETSLLCEQVQQGIIMTGVNELESRSPWGTNLPNCCQLQVFISVFRLSMEFCRQRAKGCHFVWALGRG